MSVSSATPARTAWLRGRFASWIFTTDHKRLGVLWLGTAGVAGLLGAVLATFTAIQTATADAGFLGEGTYASVRTLEETLLQYFVLVPVVVGLAVFLVPLQVGARAIAQPALVTVGFWLGAAGALTVVLAPFGPGDAPRSWWTTVPSLALDPTRGAEDARLIGLVLLGLGVLASAVSIALTLRGRRAAGMTIERLPIFARSASVYALACLVLVPLHLLGCALLLLERGNPGSFDWYLDGKGLLGGYGWVFGQAFVLVAVVPALAAAAEAAVTFTRRPTGARRVLAPALVLAAILLALVPSADDVAGKRWAAVLALAAVAPLALAALVVLLEAAGTRTPPEPAVLFAAGGALVTLAGAVAGAWLAVRHDELAGTTAAAARVDGLWCGAVLALTGGLAYWWPKVFGRLLDRRLTGPAATLATLSALLLVAARLIAGEQGQPDRTGLTLDDASTFGLLGSIGVLGLAAGLALFAVAALASVNGRRAGNDPWRGGTLEWLTTSPPPPHNFDTIPEIGSPRPLDDLRRRLDERHAR